MTGILTRVLMRLNAVIRKHVFARRAVASALFRIQLPAPPHLQSYFEWPTIVQRAILSRYICAGRRVLEVGCGAHGVLAATIKRRWPTASVFATDVVPERVAAARETFASNGLAIHCICTDLFDSIQSQFDVILFNPPQTSTMVLTNLGYRPVSAAAGAPVSWSSDGGPDGTTVIRRFLSVCPSVLGENGVVLMTISPIHTDRVVLLELIERAGLQVVRVHRFGGLSDVYAMRRCGSAL
jgi:methylase of polypeptide subunit release factors